MSRLDFDALWDYEYPDQTEAALFAISWSEGESSTLQANPARRRPGFSKPGNLPAGTQRKLFFAVDAAHMLAIASGTFEEKIAWNTTALRSAEASTDEHARGWCGSLYNNLNWTYHDQGDYERALEYFQKALQWQLFSRRSRNACSFQVGQQRAGRILLRHMLY